MNLNALHLSRTAILGIIVGLVLLAALGYLVMNNNQPEETVTATDAETIASEAEFVTLASELDSIKFDLSILSDPRFMALINIHTAITPEQRGRPDPFAPIGR